jgi:hypothetical protein
MEDIQLIREGKLRVLGRNYIRLIRLEKFYRNSRHSPSLVKSIAESMVMEGYSKNRRLIELCVPKPHMNMCLYELDTPEGCSSHLIIDYSVLLETAFLDTYCKLRNDLLIEIELYRRGHV